jgi:hypothetical protein
LFDSTDDKGEFNYELEKDQNTPRPPTPEDSRFESLSFEEHDFDYESEQEEQNTSRPPTPEDSRNESLNFEEHDYFDYESEQEEQNTPRPPPTPTAPSAVLVTLAIVMISMSSQCEPSSRKDSDKEKQSGDVSTIFDNFRTFNEALAVKQKLGGNFGIYSSKDGSFEVLKLKPDWEEGLRGGETLPLSCNVGVVPGFTPQLFSGDETVLQIYIYIYIYW